MYNRSKLVVKFDLTNANMMAELNVLSSFLSGTTYYLVQNVDSAIPVSYTHLTLPTNREV